ncbi:XapX domain-containing protein [Roseateles sp. SL47]|uniref:XapX domain-containing protein n=1 Tax=Roseateles sp. SL47 TaxID=2995138 RepID=UPI00226F7A80|nr:XapX domain-containing protein [Roseateles sp. SL47]WAC70930.1 XapX domain-containing protein [Roseateles sp. SL47]
MKPYLVSLAVGLLVGVIYALFNVRSPAPPVIALVGLLGILIGEQVPPLVKKLVHREASTEVSWLHHQVKPHMFGQLPKCAEVAAFPRRTNTHSSATAATAADVHSETRHG